MDKTCFLYKIKNEKGKSMKEDKNKIGFSRAKMLVLGASSEGIFYIQLGSDY